MKKLLLIISIYSTMYAKSQTVHTDTTFNYTLGTMYQTLYSTSFGISCYNNLIQFQSVVASHTLSTAEIKDTSINMTGIDSIKVIYTAITWSVAVHGTNIAIITDPQHTDTINLTGTAPFIYNGSFSNTTGLVTFKAEGYMPAHPFNIALENMMLIKYSTILTTSINSVSKKDLNIFAYNSTIYFNSILPNSTIKVFNSLGQIVFESILQNTIETNLPTGIYTIQVLNNNEIVEIKKCALINNQ